MGKAFGVGLNLQRRRKTYPHRSAAHAQLIGTPGHYPFDHPPRVQCIAMQNAPLHPRVGQQVVDQDTHALRTPADILNKQAPLVVEMLDIIFQQQAAVAIDTTQRRFQVVRDGIGKGVQFLISHLQLRGTFTNPCFQFGVQAPDLVLGALAFGSVMSAITRRPVKIRSGSRR